MNKLKYIFGIDEAGRGPLAGPVAVGVACVPVDFDWRLIPGVNDSKKVTEKNRFAIFLRAKMLRKQKIINFSVSLVGASVIDRIGITQAVALGISRSLHKLALDPSTADVRLDGLLEAPHEYKHQKTIIKGDQKEKAIGLASIVAKVTRDRYMVRTASRYPQYHFGIHKGYGTLVHRNLIKKIGMSALHRKTFCRNLTEKKLVKKKVLR
ncbi:MAG: ribonuclease HII [Candidatus Pacebacteria bacterium]|nr:ribonuclease HII [Candidatus Paceibacterota bacterium]MCF7857004.1 ribonuclease HII [Candidatus Paceibacterota bacterium]